MSDPSFLRFIDQPAKIQFSVAELTQIADGLSLRVAKSSGQIILVGDLFVVFNVITLGLLRKPLRPIAISFMRETVKRSSAIAMLNKIGSTPVIGIDGRNTTYTNAIRAAMEADKKK